MIRKLLPLIFLFSLCCAANAQSPKMVPGCGPLVPGGVFLGPGVPNGCQPGVPSALNGPQILLSNSTVVSSATVGTTIGTLSVINGTGSYTFSLTSNPGTLFAISGSNLNVAAALTAGSDPITIQASNGAGSVITQPFTITVTGTCSNKLDFSQACNSQYLF